MGQIQNLENFQLLNKYWYAIVTVIFLIYTHAESFLVLVLVSRLGIAAIYATVFHISRKKPTKTIGNPRFLTSQTFIPCLQRQSRGFRETLTPLPAPKRPFDGRQKQHASAHPPF